MTLKFPILAAVIGLSLSTFSQTNKQFGSVDFKTAHGELSFNFEKRSVAGKASYEFVVKKKPDTIAIDAVNMEISAVRVNGKEVKFVNSGKALKLFEGYKKGKNQLEFRYEATPKQALYFVGTPGNPQIWTQGQGKYTSHWFPSFDDVNEKMIFSLTLGFRPGYLVLSNGELKEEATEHGERFWVYAMDQPMSSYLLMVAIGPYQHKTERIGNISEELYLDANELDAKAPSTYKHSAGIFRFLQNELIPYAWGNVYRQVPTKDFFYGGMENTTSTIFSRDYVVDEIGYNDRNYANVDAHELAHQWFGDLVTAKSGEHHWLQEGFATYYALQAEREIFGEDYFHWSLYENAEMIQQASKNDTIPILRPNASSTSYYQKGAWALHALRSEIGADDFRKAVRNYLEKYKFTNVTTDNFLDEVEKVHKFDRAAFLKNWLLNPKFPVEIAMELLGPNAMLRDYFALGNLSGQPFADKKQRLSEIIASDAYFRIRQEAIYQTIPADFADKKELLETAMRSGNLQVRQAVAHSLKKIPEDFRVVYETLLDDRSYLTQEIALNALMRDFPEHRATYLDRTQGRIGFNDRNLRLLWLTLALKTENYHPELKTLWYDELLGYCSAEYEATVRQSAMQKLFFLNIGDTNILPELVHALTHPKWQFVKYARETIREKLKLPNHRKFFTELLPSLPQAEQVPLQKLLDEK